MKRIKSVSARKISKRTKTLSRLNLCNLDTEKVAYYLRISFGVPYNPFPQKAKEGFIYRACLNSSNMPFDSIKRIAYNPNPDSIGRANLKGIGVGYGASSLDTAAIESCQDSLRKTNQRIFNLTIGEWITNSDLKTAVICHYDKALITGTDLRIAYESIVRQKIEEQNYNKKQLRIWNLKNRFYANEFAKKEIKCYNDYLFSALYSNTIFNSSQPEFDCIWYPSQAYKYKGFNIAYKTKLIDSKIMTINKVYDVEIKFFKETNKYPIITIKESTTKFSNDLIQW